jgi:hypothetical protein
LVSLRTLSLGPMYTFAQRELNYLSQMQGVTVGALGNLLLATEAVGNNQLIVCRVPHFRQEHAFATFNRHILVIARFKPKSAGHSATT